MSKKFVFQDIQDGYTFKNGTSGYDEEIPPIRFRKPAGAFSQV